MAQRVSLRITPTSTGLIVRAHGYTLTFHDVQRLKTALGHERNVRHVVRLDDHAVEVWILWVVGNTNKLAAELRKSLVLYESMQADVYITRIAPYTRLIGVVPSSRLTHTELNSIATTLAEIFAATTGEVSARVHSIGARYFVVEVTGYQWSELALRGQLAAVTVDVMEVETFQEGGQPSVAAFTTFLERAFPA